MFQLLEAIFRVNIKQYIHTYSIHWFSLCVNCIWIWNMSINIRQHKTHRKIHSQDKTVKQNKTKNKYTHRSKPKYYSSSSFTMEQLHA